MAQNSKEPLSQVADKEVREMFLLAGINVESEIDVIKYVQLIKWLFAREEKYMARQMQKTKYVTAVATALVTACVGFAIQIVLHGMHLL